MSVFDTLSFKYKQGNAIIRILLINGIVFLFTSLGGLLFYLFNESATFEIWLRYLMLPASVQAFLYQPWSLFSYMFLHEGFMHVLFNLLWLYWMGSLFQQYLGNARTWQAYILGGLSGGLFFIFSFNVFPVFSAQVPFTYALGASAGVLSIVAATATLLPDYEVQLLLLGRVRLKYIALVVVIIDLLAIPGGNAGGHLAHLGGAAFGFLFVKALYSHSRLATGFVSFLDNMQTGFKPKSKLKVHYRNTGKTQTKTNNSGKPSQTEVDAILDKISRNGYESLSAREKEILFKASKN